MTKCIQCGFDVGNNPWCPKCCNSAVRPFWVFPDGSYTEDKKEMLRKAGSRKA